MRVLSLLPICLIAFACQPSRHSDDVTRNELRGIPAPALLHETARPPRKCDLDSLVAEAFSAPPPTTRAADALAVADARVAPLVSALGAIDAALDVCVDNLANADATAFKCRYAIAQPGGRAVLGVDFAQGTMRKTGRQLDVGIQGRGFFKIRIHDSKGDRFVYTRNGNFFVNHEGRLMLGTGEGYQLEPAITMPRSVTDISIGNNGRITVIRPGSIAPAAVGQLQLFRFRNPQGLHPLGRCIYAAADASGPPGESRPGENGAGEIVQGHLESSNVKPMREQLRIRFLRNWRAAILRAIESAK